MFFYTLILYTHSGQFTKPFSTTFFDPVAKVPNADLPINTQKGVSRKV